MSSSDRRDNPGKLLEKDHEDLDKLLRILLSSFESRNPGAVFPLLDLFWARLAMHIRAEHLHLFPSISKQTDEFAGTSEGVSQRQQAIAQLRSDHNFFMDHLAGAVGTLRGLLTVPDSDLKLCQLDGLREELVELSKRLESHNKLEESMIYPLPDEYLNSDERRVLGDQIRGELENLPPRFEGGSAN